MIYFVSIEKKLHWKFLKLPNGFLTELSFMAPFGKVNRKQGKTRNSGEKTILNMIANFDNI